MQAPRWLWAGPVGLAVGALALGEGAGTAVMAAAICLAWGGSLAAWFRQPDATWAAVVLLASGFVRLVLGPLGVVALYVASLVALRSGEEQERHLVAAAVGVHLAVFAAARLAGLLGEPFPALAPVSGAEAVIGLALFVPVVALGRRAE